MTVEDTARSRAVFQNSQGSLHFWRHKKGANEKGGLEMWSGCVNGAKQGLGGGWEVLRQGRKNPTSCGMGERVKGEGQRWTLWCGREWILLNFPSTSEKCVCYELGG